MQYNPYLVVPFATWVIAQLTKFIVAAAYGRQDFKYLYASGGMPSAHSAVVCSLAITALLVNGSSSPLFGLTAIFAAIVMYDSFGVRRSSGEQAAALNMLIASLENDHIHLRQSGVKLREILGHKPLEVAVGAAMGLVLGALFNWSLITPQLKFISSQPLPLEFTGYLALSGLLIIGGWIYGSLVKSRRRSSKAMRSFGNRVLVMSQTIGWMGLLFSFAQYERLSYFSWRFWSWLVLAALAAWSVWLFARWQQARQALAAEAEDERRQKWLRPRRKKSKQR